jgi:D-alanyl-D-alanine carboxypeptidase
MSLSRVRRVLTSLLARPAALAIFGALISAVPAYAARNSAIVIDANTGSVLQQSRADEARYPASITKVMTLYLLFEQMEKGRFSLDSKLKVSSFAASRPPSKLGLHPGDDIRVRDAILAVVTRSANDVAVTIAENIAGSEPAFAAMMTKKARQLGMTGTTYRNASGLPNPGQVTTARDLALLGRSLYERFPAYAKYFSTRAYNYRGRMIANHNHLLGRVTGVDGIKTGYTNASGYNLLTSVHHDGRHLVAVVMGGATGSSRDATMRMLIANYLPKASHKKMVDKQLIARIYGKDQKNVAIAMNDKTKKKSRKDETFAQAAEVLESASDENAAVAYAPAAPVKKDLNDIVAPALASAEVEEGDGGEDGGDNGSSQDTVEASAPQAIDQGLVSQKMAMEWNVGAEPALQPKEVTTFKVSPEEFSAGRADASLETETADALPVAQSLQKSPVTGWVVQIAATNSELQAMKLLSEAKDKLKFANLQPFTERVERGAATIFRARFSGIGDRKMAEATCTALKRKSYDCLAVRL